MKKIILIIMMFLLMSTMVFGESLDSNYLDLIFDKFAAMSESDKVTNQSFLEILIKSDTGLELLYKEALKKEETMEAYNITKADVRRNINALKGWSVEDRVTLVTSGATGDKSVVKKLNAKYADTITILPNQDNQTIEVINNTTLKAAFLNEEIPVVEALKGKNFRDTETHWSKDFVLYLVERDIIAGKDEFSFDPEASISKAEIVTLVTKLIIKDMTKIPAYTGDVSDIVEGKWYDGHMQRGYIIGLIEPNTEGLLQPNHNLSREEVVEILIKALDAMSIQVSDDAKVYKGSFVDFDDVSDSRKEAMTIAINLNFISGKGDGVIDPQSEIKRSEIAVVIKKLYLYILENI